MGKRGAALAVAFGLLSILLSSAAGYGASKQVIKIATLAPEGSAWMQVFSELNAEVSEKTDQAVQFRVYPGGVLGDETDMLRKMHIGQIQGAALSAPGLSMIFSDVDVFQVPFLFESYAEIDHVVSGMKSFLKAGFEKGGYVLLGWSEGGFVYLMSTTPVASLDEMRKAKVWTWQDAPMAKIIFDEAQISAIPLSIPDVLLGLQTGLVDVVYAPPAGAISLQWFTRVKYMVDLPLLYLAGGIVVKKSVFDRLPAAVQETVLKLFDTYMVKLKSVLRSQNQEAVQVMQKQGITLITPPDEEVRKFKDLSRKASLRMVDNRFSKRALDAVNGYIEQFRKAATK